MIENVIIIDFQIIHEDKFKFMLIALYLYCVVQLYQYRYVHSQHEN